MRGSLIALLVLGAGVAQAESQANQQAKPQQQKPAAKSDDDMKKEKKDPRADARFPQPVRVGDLPSRYLIEPEESQHILGRVQGVVKAQDGSNQLVVKVGGRFAWLGFGNRLALVPTDDVALLGQYVALMDIDPDDLPKQPTFKPGSLAALASKAVIKVGIVKPFH